MHQKKIYKVIEAINEKLETITIEELNDYSAGNGLLTILEECIDQVLWDKESIDTFWKTYQSTTYDGTPLENAVSYAILYEYFGKALATKILKLQFIDNGGNE